jgi:hypothetical protein
MGKIFAVCNGHGPGLREWMACPSCRIPVTPQNGYSRVALLPNDASNRPEVEQHPRPWCPTLLAERGGEIGILSQVRR